MMNHEDSQNDQPRVGILTIEGFDDWLDDLNQSIEDFADRAMGSWFINYMQALQVVGFEPILFCISNKVVKRKMFRHAPSGAKIVVLPPPKLYGMVKRWLPRYRPSTGAYRLGIAQQVKMLACRAFRFIMSYFSTPLVSLFGEMRKRNIRFLLVQEYETARFDICVLVAKLRGLKVYGTFQGFLPHHFLLRPLRRLSLHLCDGLLIPSKAEAERVKRQYGYPDQRIQAVYTPIDCSLFHVGAKKECRDELGIEEGVKLAIYHGRIDMEYKGLDVLLDAWEILCKNRPTSNTQLLIIGTGPDDSEFAQRLSERSFHRVTWLRKWINDQRIIRQYLTSADVYIFPSRGDACPNAVIEAMACGLPVIASDINGIADILANGEKSGGILVPPGDAYALAQALNYCLDKKELLDTLGKRARCHVEQSLSMEIIGNQLKEIFMDGRIAVSSATVL